MLDQFCRLAGAELRAEPGPEPVHAQRYMNVLFCNTSQFVILHSWTNGKPLVQPEII